MFIIRTWQSIGPVELCWYLCELKGEMFWTREREDATRYETELDAKCALCYVPDDSKGTIVEVDL